jgi:hypothetical protein
LRDEVDRESEERSIYLVAAAELHRRCSPSPDTGSQASKKRALVKGEDDPSEGRLGKVFGEQPHGALRGLDTRQADLDTTQMAMGSQPPGARASCSCVSSSRRVCPAVFGGERRRASRSCSRTTLLNGSGGLESADAMHGGWLWITKVKMATQGPFRCRSYREQPGELLTEAHNKSDMEL